MPSNFTLHTVDSAPAASKPLLEASTKEWGFLPTLHAILGESAPTLKAYQSLFALVPQTSFTPIEQQIAYLAVNVANECEYCTAGHTYLARSVGMPETTIYALREQEMIAEPRWQALRSFVDAVVRARGRVADDDVDAFIAAGYSKAQVLEVVLIIATKVISNYVNHIAHTPAEAFMADPSFGWVAPSRRQAA